MSSSAPAPPPSSSPLCPDLPQTTTFITGHTPDGKAHVHSTRPAAWKSFDGGDMGFNQIYTNPFPADLSNDADIAFHDEKISSGNLGLVAKSGTVCRMVDFSPEYVCLMHRTQSLDFGIVVEGEVDMLLDDGSSTRLKRGDVAVQRATMHAWRNPSKTSWTRMIFVLQDAKPLFIDGKRYGEDLGNGTEGLLPSGNDD